MKRDLTTEQPGARSRRSGLCRTLRALDTGVNATVGRLSSRQRSALLLGISLLFAGAMIAVSWFLGPESSQTLVFVLIAVWWIPFSVLSSAPDRY